MHDGRQVHLHDDRQIHIHDQTHNPSSSSTDINPPMAIQAPEEEVVPSKLKMSRKKAPTSEAGLAQTRLVANLIDGFREVRNAHRAQQQADRRLAIEDQAPRGRTTSRTQSIRDDQTPEYTTKGGQLVMNDASKRGRSRPKSRDETPEYPIEGTELISDISNKKKPKEHRKRSCDHTSNDIGAT